ncbi:hypothetical protein F2Q68_00030176 [Brassica cretica]|uniref:Uncharacterized protein n=1 Tax=Brassica cretica TaxID=69181 RepID=A0A8S9GBK2_BRACR|nr:hypothetical protein F2Q68_00030176 [Brassica cretica]
MALLELEWNEWIVKRCGMALDIPRSKANHLKNDEEELGRYVATEQNRRSVATIRTKLYLGNIRCDVFLTEHDLLRKDILVLCGDLDVSFVVTVFDPIDHRRVDENAWTNVVSTFQKSSGATYRPSGTDARIRTKLYLGNIRCDVFLTVQDLLRKDILVFCGDLDVNFVVTVFDPNSAGRPRPWAGRPWCWSSSPMGGATVVLVVLAHGRGDRGAGRPRPWARRTSENGPVLGS